MQSTMKHDIAAEATKAAPPWALAYLTASELLTWLSIAYLVLQIAFLGYKWVRLHRNKPKDTE